jgi:carotenoid cleavage dioxygenase-like enzyme
LCRFDGDGMVHAVHFGEGKAKSYSNHWIRCDRFVEEREAGSNVYMRVRLLILSMCVLVLTSATEHF